MSGVTSKLLFVYNQMLNKSCDLLVTNTGNHLIPGVVTSLNHRLGLLRTLLAVSGYLCDGTYHMITWTWIGSKGIILMITT